MVSLSGSASRLLRRLAQRAAKEGTPLYMVGGCVRDAVLKAKDGQDVDLVLETDPAPLARHCAKLLNAPCEAFGRFGTLRVLGKDLRVDFAASRKEEYPEPADLPVVSPAQLEVDLFRRDFTINAMAVEVTPKGLGKVIDPYGGLADLKARRLKVLHPMSFRDDPTRVFRAARFLCRFGFKPAAGLLESAQTALSRGHAAKLSRHRLLQELLCVLDEKDSGPALKRLKGWGYLQLIHPELGVRARGKNADERLASLALALGAEGESFLKSLPLERVRASELHEALALVREKASPRRAPSSLAARVVKTALPALPAAALKPLWIGGDDLQKLGVAPGKDYRGILDAAAREQWKGKIASRKQALAWLRRRLSVRP